MRDSLSTEHAQYCVNRVVYAGSHAARDHELPSATSTVPLTVGPLRYELPRRGLGGVAARRLAGPRASPRPSLASRDRDLLIYAGLAWDDAGRGAKRAGAPARARRAPDLGAGVSPRGWAAHDLDTGSAVWLLGAGSNGASSRRRRARRRGRSRYHFPWQPSAGRRAAWGRYRARRARRLRRSRLALHGAARRRQDHDRLRLPEGWRLLGDDGCLLWPSRRRLHGEPAAHVEPHAGRQRRAARHGHVARGGGLPVAGTVVLDKAAEDGL